MRIPGQDNGAWLVLRAMSCGFDTEGSVGTARLKVGGQSMIAWAVSRSEPRIAQDVAADPLYQGFPLLPDTRSEAVLPMMIGEGTIGALDVQSDRTEAFSQDAVTVLKTMAYQIALSVQHARLYSEERTRSHELSEAYKALQKNQERSLIAEKWPLGRLTARIAHEMNTCSRP